MRPDIVEKMQEEINVVELYNGMFETAIASAETTLSTIAEKVEMNQYVITNTNIIVRIISTDPIASVYATIEYVTGESTSSVIAEASFSKDGTYDEKYLSVPPSIRSQVYDIMSTMIDDVVEFINNFQPSST